jgi:hypothetical protein
VTKATSAFSLKRLSSRGNAMCRDGPLPDSCTAAKVHPYPITLPAGLSSFRDRDAQLLCRRSPAQIPTSIQTKSAHAPPPPIRGSWPSLLPSVSSSPSSVGTIPSPSYAPSCGELAMARSTAEMAARAASGASPVRAGSSQPLPDPRCGRRWYCSSRYSDSSRGNLSPKNGSEVCIGSNCDVRQKTTLGAKQLSRPNPIAAMANRRHHFAYLVGIRQ